MKNLRPLRTFALLFLAIFSLIQCKPDKNLSALKQKPTEGNTMVIQTDTGVVAVTDLKRVGRYAYYTNIIMVTDTSKTGGEIGSTGVASSSKGPSWQGTFKGYVNVYTAKLPVVGGSRALEITFATTLDLLKETPGVDEITDAGPYKVTLLTTDEFLVGTEKTSQKPDSLYVFDKESLENPPPSALIFVEQTLHPVERKSIEPK